MQTVLASRALVAGTPVRSSSGTSRCARASVVVRAMTEGESRRAVVGSFLAGVAALAATPAMAIDLFDDRKAIDKGFNLIYEARDLDLPQATRDGLSQARASAELTKSRILESEKRLDGKVGEFIAKEYWTLAREELRGQLGTLRFDINTLASQLPKDARKAVLALKTDFVTATDDLDFAIRKKDPAKASEALKVAQAKLDAVIKALG